MNGEVKRSFVWLVLFSRQNEKRKLCAKILRFLWGGTNRQFSDFFELSLKMTKLKKNYKTPKI